MNRRLTHYPHQGFGVHQSIDPAIAVEDQTGIARLERFVRDIDRLGTGVFLHAVTAMALALLLAGILLWLAVGPLFCR